MNSTLVMDDLAQKNVEIIPPGVDLNRFHPVDINSKDEEKELNKLF